MIQYFQPATTETIDLVKDRYVNAGWGIAETTYSMTEVTGLIVKWLSNPPPQIPAVSDLNLEFPHRL